MTEVLFAQRVIPNYRVGAFRKFAAMPDISLTVSWWTERFQDRTPHVDHVSGFDTVAFEPVRWRVCGRDCWFNFDLFEYLVRARPDVVIGPVKMFGLHSVVSKLVEDLVTLLIGTSFVYRVSFGRWPDKPERAPMRLRTAWSKWLYRNVVVTAYSQRAARVVKRNGCPPDRVLVDLNAMNSDELLAIRGELADAVDTWKAAFLRRYGIARGGYVLFVGRISPRKRLDLLIEAWKKVVERVDDVQLVIVGSGPGRNEAICQAKHMAERIVFVEGIYDTEELAKFYYLASVVVFPGYNTLSTHFGMCFSKPIVASEYGNEADYVRAGENGFIYEYGNVEDLSSKIMLLLGDDTMRDTFGEKSLRMVEERINVGHMVNTWHHAVRVATSDKLR